MLSQVMKQQTKIYNTVIPILTDVSLRNGDNWPLSKKQDVFHQIVTTYYPDYIEVGSLYKPNSLDTVTMFKYANDYKSFRSTEIEHYVLIPELNNLKQALDHNVTQMSFLTSVSHLVQRRVHDQSMYEAKSALNEICKRLSHRDDIRKKLYISCISECPYAGPLNIDYILHEICMYHHKYSFDELCLSDTCGTLTFENYKYLVDALYVFGVPKTKIGIHLKMKNMTEVEKIVRYSLKNDILHFDVSAIESDNLTYDVFMSIYNKVFTNSNI
jgi:isopropylmalate/homocitrate/citramalate synthase